jgi:hypothetical protein
MLQILKRVSCNSVSYGIADYYESTFIFVHTCLAKYIETGILQCRTHGAEWKITDHNFIFYPLITNLPACPAARHLPGL